MLRRRQQPQRRPARGFTAAATIFDPLDPEDAKKVEKSPAEWQRQALDFFDMLGEIHFAARYMGDALSQLRLFPAMQLERDQPPVPITPESEPDEDPRVAAIEDETRVLLNAAVDRLAAPEGGQSEILRMLGVNMFLVGEAWVVGYTDEEDDEERWEVFSVDNVVKHEEKIKLKLEPDQRPDKYRELTAEDFICRVYRRHPRWPSLADAPMRGVLNQCEELAVLSDAIMAQATSRIPADMLVIPEEASFPDADEAPADAEGDDENQRDPLTADLIEHMETAIRNPRSAARWVPFILRVSGEDADKVKPIHFSREIDATMAAQRDELRGRIAAGVDLPAEVLTGKTGINHWTAWQLGEEEFKNHVEPAAKLLVASLTVGWFRPQLEATDVEEPGRFCLHYDATSLVSHPNRADNAFKLRVHRAIGDSALRTVTGFTDEDAPDDDERARWLEEDRAKAPARPGGPAGPETTEPNPPEGPEAPDEARVVPMRPALVAAAGLASLGEVLASTERGLRQRVQSAADAEMRRALERAGNRLRSRAQRGSGEIQRMLRGEPAHLRAARLGPSLLGALDTSPDDLLAGAFDGLEDRYLRWTRQAQLAAVDEVRRRSGNDLDARAEDDVLRRQEEDRGNGWAALAASLIVLAGERLFTPSPELPARGEFDEGTLVPPGTVRESLAVAGGGAPSEAPGTPAPAVGALSGETMGRVLRFARIRTRGYTWAYGDPGSRSQPFEPHLDLDEVEFAGWEDPALANDLEFPEEAFFFPGDHLGCQCDFVRDLEAGESAGEELPGEAAGA